MTEDNKNVNQPKDIPLVHKRGEVMSMEEIDCLLGILSSPDESGGEMNRPEKATDSTAEKSGNVSRFVNLSSMCEYGEVMTTEEIDYMLSSASEKYTRRSNMDKNLISKAICSSKEKDGMMKLIAEIISLCNVARRCGLLELEEMQNKLSCDFLKIGIRLLLKGIDPTTIEDTMLKTVYAENFKGAELFKRLIIIEGVLSIQGGDDSQVIKTKLFSMFGEEKLLEAVEDSSKIDLKLDKYNFFESETFSLVKRAFANTLKSPAGLKHLASFFLFRDNKEAISNNVNGWLAAIWDYVYKALRHDVNILKKKNLSVAQLKELASLIQASFLNDKKNLTIAISEALGNNENIQTDYRNMKIDEYEAEFRSRVREFFKVVLSLITEKRNFLQRNYSFLRDIIDFTIIEGKAAVKFIKDDNQLIVLGKLEKEVFGLSELKECENTDTSKK